MKLLYIHLHIPKNAGTTFDAILRRNFGSGFVRAPEPTPGYVMSLDEKRAWLQTQPNATCVSGHAFRYPAPPQTGREYRYITFLREPVARLVSLYAYEHKKTANPDHGSRRPIEEWIDYRLCEKNALENYQTMHLLGVANPSELDLNRAQKLVDELFLVGLTEDFDNSLRLLSQRGGFGMSALTYDRVNVTNSNERYPISAATQQRLLALNRLDAELYAYAREKFATDVASLPTVTATPERPPNLNTTGTASLRRLLWRVKQRWLR